MDIVGVPKESFPQVYPLVRTYFDNFEERAGGLTTANELASLVIEGKRQCWIAWDGKVKACALTEVYDGPTRLVQITYCAGEDRDTWQKPLIDAIDTWARDMGADKLEIIHRPGYAKFLRGQGFRETHRIMERNIV